MRPKICNKNPIVVVPFHEEDCEFWLVTTTSLDSIDKPSQDHAYLLPNGYFYVYNGTKFVQVNDHSDLKVKWGNLIGDINNQKDLIKLFNDVNDKISNNKNEITKIKSDITNINGEISDLNEKYNSSQGQIDDIDYIATISRNGTNVPKNEYRNVDIKVPTNVSELDNDAHYLTEQQFEEESKAFVKGVTQNGYPLQMDSQQIVDVSVPTKLSQLTNDSSFSTTTIYKGTSETPPSDWKDGDIYVMYE